VHCVVWAKFLFTQLFTDTDLDEEDSGILDLAKLDKKDPHKIFQFLFRDDILALKRTPIELPE
jgi:hypothetical protein